MFLSLVSCNPIRFSFIFRRQYKEGQDVHAVMHVTGFIRAWPPAGYGNEAQSEPIDDVTMGGPQGAASGTYCLVAVARLQVRIILCFKTFQFFEKYSVSTKQNGVTI